MKKYALALIFKVPEKGKIKTRLAADIGQQLTLKYYEMMLDSTLKTLEKLKNVDILGFYRGNLGLLNLRIPLFEQSGKDLGEIIYNAFVKIKKLGYQKIAFVGSDSPDLPIDYIENAFTKAENHDFVIGPTEDGGFYLLLAEDLGLEIFNGVIWSSVSVLERLIKNIADRGKDYFLLPKWYDVDDKKTLERWLKGN